MGPWQFKFANQYANCGGIQVLLQTATGLDDPAITPNNDNPK
jgi:hypothetical protein